MKKLQLTNDAISRYDRDTLLARLAVYYSAYYDEGAAVPFACGSGDTAVTLALRRDYHVTESSYVLLKNAKLWENQSHEYAYIFTAPHLTRAGYNAAVDFAYREGMALIKPAAGHKCTVLSALFVCDSADADAVRALCRNRLYKSFRFSFYGWMNFHTALLLREGNRVLTNSAGRGKMQMMKYIFAPRRSAKKL